MVLKLFENQPNYQLALGILLIGLGVRIALFIRTIKYDWTGLIIASILLLGGIYYVINFINHNEKLSAFFKPTKRKFMFFGLVLVLINVPWIGFFNFSSQCYTFAGSCPPHHLANPLFWLLPIDFSGIPLYDFIFKSGWNTPKRVIFKSAIIIYWYFLASLIDFWYAKRKAKLSKPSS